MKDVRVLLLEAIRIVMAQTICYYQNAVTYLNASFSETLPSLVSLPLPEHVTKLLQWAPVELRLLPQIGRQEAVCVADSHEGSLQRILESFRRAGRGSIGVLDTCEL